MVQVTLKDKGYYNVAQTKGNNTSEEMAYGSDGAKGTVLNLNVMSIDLSMNNPLNKEVALAKKDDDDDSKRFEMGEVDKIVFDYPIWTIKGTFNVTVAGDMKDFGRLAHMCKTKGYKELGFDSSATKDQAHIITYSHYGEKEYDAEATKTVDYVNVRIQKFETKQILVKGYKLEYSLELVETN